MSVLRDERNDIREMSVEQARTELAKARREVFDLRMQHQRGEVKDMRAFARTRKRVARLMHKLHIEALIASGEIEFADDEQPELLLPSSEDIEAEDEEADDDEAEDADGDGDDEDAEDDDEPQNDAKAGKVKK
jgi:ribosomal protein L29